MFRSVSSNLAQTLRYMGGQLTVNGAILTALINQTRQDKTILRDFGLLGGMGIVRAARLMSKFGRICLDDMDIRGHSDAQTSLVGFALAARRLGAP